MSMNRELHKELAKKTLQKRRLSELQEPTHNRLVSVDDCVATVVSPKRFRSGRVGWFGQQQTVINGEKVHVQVHIIKGDVDTK